MSDDLTFDEEAAAMEQIVRNQLAIRELEEQNALLKQFFKDRPERYPAGTNLKRGKFKLVVSSNSRIDQKLAEKVLTPRELRTVSKSVVDSTAARRYLTGEQIEKITKKYENRLTFELDE